MLPLLFAIVFGIIDFGNSFNDWISVRQGARDGLRQVIVKTNPTFNSCTVNGFTGATGTDTTAIICYTKTRVGLDATRTAVRVTLGTGGAAAGQPVKVCVQYKTNSLSRFYANILDNKVLDTEVESLLEQTSTGITGSFWESTFGDGSAVNWSSTCQQV